MKDYKLFMNTLLLGLFISGCDNNDQEKHNFVQSLVQKMTLEEKVGQMTQVDKRMLDSEKDIADYFLSLIHI